MFFRRIILNIIFKIGLNAVRRLQNLSDEVANFAKALGVLDTFANSIGGHVIFLKRISR